VNKKKIILILGLVVMSILVYYIEVSSKLRIQGNEYLIENSYNISPTSNFFSQPENQEQITLPNDYAFELALKGFKFVSETQDLKLYVKENIFAIAIYDKNSGYIWYSIKPNYMQYGLSGTNRFFVESGVVIEYYNLDNILIDDSKSYLSGPKYNVEVEYEYLDNGVLAKLDFEDLGIKFDVLVTIQADVLSVLLPIDSLIEEDVSKTMLNLDGSTYEKITKYRLKSVFLFPYFGSGNYEINGYSMIPDGSGALIRYSEQSHSTAYIKRIYGIDEGVRRYRVDEASSHIKPEFSASMPIFGVNHGYNQAAFLAVVSQGDGYSEIHSYPYGYNTYPFNTTFAKFIVRERFTIDTSANDSFQMVNTLPYPTDFQVDYYFLANDKANYSNMALKYKEVLGISDKQTEFGLNITLLGQDYKNGLFGRDFVKMTDYEDVLMIAKDLNSSGVLDLGIQYTGWNKGGFYGNTTPKVKTSNLLGSKQDFIDLMDYLEGNKITISFMENPILAYENTLGSSIIRKTTLSVFATNNSRTSLISTMYFRNPQNLAKELLKKQNDYQALGINNLSLSAVGNALFSYRYNNEYYYRNQMIDILREEFLKLGEFKIEVTMPNAYLFDLISGYHNIPIESNKYAYVTDSIPFIQMVLSNSVKMYSPYVNYVSDYRLMALRLIEFSINPAFLITKESTHLLRYTNSEHIYTSEYRLWKETILYFNEMVNEVFNSIEGSEIINHRYLDYGIAEVVYANNKVIYINYTESDYQINDSMIIPSAFYLVGDIS